MNKEQLQQKNIGFFSMLTKKNCLIFLFSLFLILSIIVAVMPYDPERDLADATTNDIWVEYYAKGIYHVPYDEWDHEPTQSVVVEYEDDYVVVNEKGPGHVMMLLPFHALGIEFIFGPLMVAIAIFSIYMLGKRLHSWQIGFLASVLFLVNSLVLIMWHRYYWTDASTAHVLIFSIWLLVEAIYWFNGQSLDPKNGLDVNLKQGLIGITLCFFSGLTFGISVSTRYPTGLILIAMGLFVLVFYLIKVLPDLKKRKIGVALKKSAGMWIIIGLIILGLMVILVPLMSYNSTYFGSSFGSGYDATSLLDANAEGLDPFAGTDGPSEVGLNPRNMSTTWSSSYFSFDRISKTVTNFFSLLPILIFRMPYLIFVPFGIWFFRKKPGVVLLFFLIFINFYTYLSVSAVDLYSAHPEAVWEPRYLMPAVAGTTLLGSIGIYAIAKWIIQNKKIFSNMSNERRKVIARKFVIVTVCIFLIIAAISAFLYFIVFRANLPDPHLAMDGTNPFGPLPPGFGFSSVQSIQLKIGDNLYQKILPILFGI